MSEPRRDLVIACGALVREILGIVEANGFTHLDVRGIPALLHNRPERIPDAVRTAIRDARSAYRRIFVAFADCGTGGMLDRVLREEGVQRLPGAHCYAFYSGVAAFADRADLDMRAFYLTDFLVRQFDTLVFSGLALDRHPELRDTYFGAYEKVVYLAQTHDPQLRQAAAAAADRLRLPLEFRFVGLGDLEPALADFARQSMPAHPPA